MRQSSPGRPLLLVVEDDDALRHALASLLRDEGYAAAEAANGAEALAYLRHEGEPDLILLDLLMPVMDGWEMRRQQLQDPALSGIPVLLMSASERVLAQSAALGVSGFVMKPFEVEALLLTIEAQLETRRAGATMVSGSKPARVSVLDF